MMKKNQVQKTIRMMRSYFLSKFLSYTPLFMHVAPVRRCNISCSYCYQSYNNQDMELNIFKNHVDELYKQNLSIVSFSGGEPTLWKHLSEAIIYCNSKNIFTQLTSNGIDLTIDHINKLHDDGLDYISISIDSVSNESISKKTIHNSKHLLQHARQMGMLVSSNIVLNKHNFDEIEEILTELRSIRVPASIGIVVSPPNPLNRWNGSSYCFSSNELNSVVRRMLSLYPRFLILEPKQYFENIAVEDKRSVWNCHKASQRSIHLDPDGKVLWCLKLNQVAPFSCNDISNGLEHSYREKLQRISIKCNERCYSNCAYSSFYYDKHPFRFLYKLLESYSFTYREQCG